MNFEPIKRGVVCPTVTPLKDNGDINPDMVKPLVDYLIDRGVAGVYPLGTTGQGPLFSLDERKSIAAATVAAVEADACLLSSTPAPSAPAIRWN